MNKLKSKLDQTLDFVKKVFQSAGHDESQVEEHTFVFLSIYLKKFNTRLLDKFAKENKEMADQEFTEEDKKELLDKIIKKFVSAENAEERIIEKTRVLKQTLDSFYNSVKEELPSASPLHKEYLEIKQDF